MSRYMGQDVVRKAAHRRTHAARIDAFADLLAEGVSTREAAKRLGQKPSWGNNTLAHIKRGLGWQAQ